MRHCSQHHTAVTASHPPSKGALGTVTTPALHMRRCPCLVLNSCQKTQQLLRLGQATRNCLACAEGRRLSKDGFTVCCPLPGTHVLLVHCLVAPFPSAPLKQLSSPGLFSGLVFSYPPPPTFPLPHLTAQLEVPEHFHGPATVQVLAAWAQPCGSHSPKTSVPQASKGSADKE